MGKRRSILLSALLLAAAPAVRAQAAAHDPGVRPGAAGAGGPIDGLTTPEFNLFDAGKDDFEEAEGVGDGLGPRLNLDSCGGCHAQPAIGGTSPAVNPQIAVATMFGAHNTVPSFLSASGPVREVRFKRRPDGTRDGGVHALFVIAGRNDPTGDATGCNAVQENFNSQAAAGNVIFRIPTPVFGGGLIEQIPDGAILANASAQAAAKQNLGIGGRPNHVRISGTTNRNGNDGTISRFGWKAQNKSLLLFSGEAYNVEMGISNEIFQTERDENPTCQFATTPNSVTNPEGASPAEVLSSIERFSFFMRFAAAPVPSSDTPGGATSINSGKAVFQNVGCALCHTPALQTGNSTVAALSNQSVPLYSDLLVHHMGPGLADDVVQGEADGDEFRTAPLWGLGQRRFFLHDGRTGDLVQAILAHRSNRGGGFQASEANGVVNRFDGLGDPQKQDLLNFLRSL